MPSASFPALRLRRTRAAAWSRALVAETVLTPADLIWPLFVTEGKGVEEPIATPAGRVALVGRPDRRAGARGARRSAFPASPCSPTRRAACAATMPREALNPDNLICRAVRAAKDAAPEVGVLTDVALDPYTAHGHDGLIDEAGYVLNDATGDDAGRAGAGPGRGRRRHRRAVRHDGRPRRRDPLSARSRRAMSTSRSWPMPPNMRAPSTARSATRSARAACSRATRRATRWTRPMREEALREVALDLAEGADSVMVKPGLPYLDIVRRVKERFEVPVFAYQVSGEYAMIEAAAAAGAGERDALVLETLMAFKRAGCAGVLTYHAPLGGAAARRSDDGGASVATEATARPGERALRAAALPAHHHHRLVPALPDPADDRAHGAAAGRRRAGGVEQRDAGLPGCCCSPAMPMPTCCRGCGRGARSASISSCSRSPPCGCRSASPARCRPADGEPAFWVPWFLLVLDRAALLHRLRAGAADAALVRARDAAAAIPIRSTPPPISAASPACISYPLLVEPLMTPAAAEPGCGPAIYALLVLLVAACALTVPADAVEAVPEETGAGADDGARCCTGSRSPRCRRG